MANLKLFAWCAGDVRTIPAEIGLLSNLQVISLSLNPNLENLPLSLGQLPNLVNIEIDTTKIPVEQRDAILAQCKALRSSQAAENLVDRLKTWKLIGKTEIDLSEIEKFDSEKKASIDEWMRRLEITKDFEGSSQAWLAETVCQILNSAINDKTFRESFFVQIESNLEKCGDRAGMALNEIYTVWKLSQLPSEALTRDKLQVMQQGAMTLALRAAIANRIDQHQKQTNTIEQEATQIYLYYEISLKDELNLLSAIKTMLYEEIGKRDWIDRASLIEEVNRNYLDYLMDLPAFEELIAQDNVYVEECEAQTKQLKDKVSELQDKEPQGVDNALSTEYLEWQAQMGELNTQISTIISDTTKRWVKEKLGSKDK